VIEAEDHERDDNAVVLDRVGVLLRPSFEVVGAVTNGQELFYAGMSLAPDVIVADIQCRYWAVSRPLNNSAKQAPELGLSF
jgi:hypothetical protein